MITQVTAADCDAGRGWSQVGCGLQATDYGRVAAYCLLPTAYCLLPISNVLNVLREQHIAAGAGACHADVIGVGAST